MEGSRTKKEEVITKYTEAEQRKRQDQSDKKARPDLLMTKI